MLTSGSALTFQADATYQSELNSSTTSSDAVIANGVSINGGAQIALSDLGNTALPEGTVFTAIENTAATPIGGTFSNLADGSTVTVGSNTYQVSYEGGTGNDLTFAVQ